MQIKLKKKVKSKKERCLIIYHIAWGFNYLDTKYSWIIYDKHYIFFSSVDVSCHSCCSYFLHEWILNGNSYKEWVARSVSREFGWVSFFVCLSRARFLSLSSRLPLLFFSTNINIAISPRRLKEYNSGRLSSTEHSLALRYAHTAAFEWWYDDCKNVRYVCDVCILPQCRKRFTWIDEHTASEWRTTKTYSIFRQSNSRHEQQQ